MTADKGDRNVETKSTSGRAAHKNEASLSHEPIEISVGSGSAATQRTELIAVGVFAEGTLSPSAKTIDEASKGRLVALIARGDLESKPGASLMLFDLPGVTAQRALLVSLGAQRQFDDKM